MKNRSALLLNQLQLSVFLGINPEELLNKQHVTLDACIRFEHPPEACQSDLILDTYCYDRIIRCLKEKLADRKFNMLEYLTREIYQLLKTQLPAATLSVRVTKIPAIENLKGGVTFEYGDGPAS